MAFRPPAEAPIPTIGKLFGGGGSAWRFFSFVLSDIDGFRISFIHDVFSTSPRMRLRHFVLSRRDEERSRLFSAPHRDSTV